MQHSGTNNPGAKLVPARSICVRGDKGVDTSSFAEFKKGETDQLRLGREITDIAITPGMAPSMIADTSLRAGDVDDAC
jgi:hypothetical protein